MYLAIDNARKKVVRQHERYGAVLQWLMSTGYYDPESYTIIWRPV